MSIDNRNNFAQHSLEVAFDFQASDLALNQAGLLSEKQIARLTLIQKARAQSAVIAHVVFGFLVFILIVAAFYVQQLREIDSEAKIVLLGTISVMVLLLLLSLIYEFLTRRPLMKMKLSKVDGVIRTKTKQLNQRCSGGISEAYFFRIQGSTYQLESFEHSNVLLSGRHYRFFFVKNPVMPIVLSVEYCD